MSTAITVFKRPTLNGRIFVSVAAPAKRVIESECGDDPAEAAALAMSYAVHCEHYAIFASSDVLAHIPQNFRTK